VTRGVDAASAMGDEIQNPRKTMPWAILVGGAGSTFIGNVVYSSVGIANNVPFAAALATVPVAIMALYLLAAKRLGAFEAL